MSEGARASGNKMRDRRQRLAEALRANLKRRKAQERARSTGARNDTARDESDTTGESS